MMEKKKHKDPQPNIWWGLGNPVEREGRIVGSEGLKTSQENPLFILFFFPLFILTAQIFFQNFLRTFKLVFF